MDVCDSTINLKAAAQGWRGEPDRRGHRAHKPASRRPPSKEAQQGCPWTDGPVGPRKARAVTARRRRDSQAAAHGLEDLRQLGLLADELRLEAEYAWTDMPADDDWDWWLELESDKAWEAARAGFASELARLDAIKALAAADKAAWDAWAPARAGVRRGLDAARRQGLRRGATGKRPSVRAAMAEMGL